MKKLENITLMRPTKINLFDVRVFLTKTSNVCNGEIVAEAIAQAYLGNDERTIILAPKYPNGLQPGIMRGGKWVMRLVDFYAIEGWNGFVELVPNEKFPAVQCACGRIFLPSYGEYKRCQNCLGRELDTAELATVPGYDC